jgi:mycoredoxin
MTKAIKVYGTDWCRLTFGVREYLLIARIDYDFFDIDRDPAADAYVRAVGNGVRRYPVVAFPDEVVVTPTMADLVQLLRVHEAQPAPRRRRLADTGDGESASDPEWFDSRG